MGKGCHGKKEAGTSFYINGYTLKTKYKNLTIIVIIIIIIIFSLLTQKKPSKINFILDFLIFNFAFGQNFTSF
jgi:hypothetical protein